MDKHRLETPANRKNPPPIPLLTSINPVKITNKTKLAVYVPNPLPGPKMGGLLNPAQKIRKQRRIQIQRQINKQK